MGNCDFSLPALPTNNKTPGRAYYSTRCFVVGPNSVPIKNRVFGLSFNGGAVEALYEHQRQSYYPLSEIP